MCACSPLCRSVQCGIHALSAHMAHGHAWPCQVTLACAGSCRVSFSHTPLIIPHWVAIPCLRCLQSCTGLHRVMQGHAGSHRVVHGHAWPHMVVVLLLSPVAVLVCMLPFHSPPLQSCFLLHMCAAPSCGLEQVPALSHCWYMLLAVGHVSMRERAVCC